MKRWEEMTPAEKRESKAFMVEGMIVAEETADQLRELLGTAARAQLQKRVETLEGENNSRYLCFLLAQSLVSGDPIDPGARKFLGEALLRIHAGEDANEALGLPAPGSRDQGRPKRPAGKFLRTWVTFRGKLAELDPDAVDSEGGRSRPAELRRLAILDAAEELGLSERTVRAHIDDYVEFLKELAVSLAESGRK